MDSVETKVESSKEEIKKQYEELYASSLPSAEKSSDSFKDPNHYQAEDAEELSDFGDLGKENLEYHTDLRNCCLLSEAQFDDKNPDLSEQMFMSAEKAKEIFQKAEQEFEVEK